MKPEHEHYDTIERWIRRSVREKADFLFDVDKFDEELHRVWDEYDVHPNTTRSFFQNLHTVHVKRNSASVKKAVPGLVERFLHSAANENDSNTNLIELAKEVNYPPYLLFRLILEHCTTLKAKTLTEVMRDPTTLEIDHFRKPMIIPEDQRCERLRERCVEEIQSVVFEKDPLYGPVHDRSRHVMGIEYEVVLEDFLRRRKIPFVTEATLREKGTSKTPDVVLDVPIAIRIQSVSASSGRDHRNDNDLAGGNKSHDPDDDSWKMICWIDSKALFGDVDTHRTSVLPQAEGYVHRFGPGLIVYWMGHAPRLAVDDSVYVLDGTDLDYNGLLDTYMLPTGAIITADPDVTSRCRKAPSDGKET